MTIGDQLEKDVEAILNLDRADAPPAPPPAKGRDRWALAGGLLLMLGVAGAGGLAIVQMRAARPVTRFPIASMEPASEPRIRVSLPAAAAPVAAIPPAPGGASDATATRRRRSAHDRAGFRRRARASARREKRPVESASDEIRSTADGNPRQPILIPAPPPPATSGADTTPPPSAPTNSTDKAAR